MCLLPLNIIQDRMRRQPVLNAFTAFRVERGAGIHQYFYVRNLAGHTGPRKQALVPYSFDETNWSKPIWDSSLIFLLLSKQGRLLVSLSTRSYGYDF